MDTDKPFRSLVLCSSRADRQAALEIAAGLRPRLDYLEIAAKLNADVLDTRGKERLSSWARRLEGAAATDLHQAQVAWGRRGLYAGWLSASEKVGLPLALLGAGDHSAPAHVMIAHHLSSSRKQSLHKLSGVLHWGFSDIICLSSSQRDYLLQGAGLPARRVHCLTHHVDTHFYHPIPCEEGEYLLAVGQENRDYPTLIAAAARLHIPLVIVASSLWAKQTGILRPEELPEHVTLRHEFISYAALRDLYAGARMVAVPLKPCAYAAGSTGLLEAMAMGKAVVVSETEGLTDYLTQKDSYKGVSPSEVGALSEAIGVLWNDLPVREAMGRTARAHVEKEMNMERYVDSVSAIMYKAMEEKGHE